MKKAVFFAIVAAVLLVPWVVAYGYDKVNAAVNDASIEAADPALAPAMNVFGNAVGSVTAGDLFIIDTSGTEVDAAFTLLMTNIDELIHNYRFVILRVGIYVQTDIDYWEKLEVVAGESIPDTYITMQGGSVSFTIPGNAKYKVMIEGGSYRSYSIASGQKVAIPQFSLTAG